MAGSEDDAVVLREIADRMRNEAPVLADALHRFEACRRQALGRHSFLRLVGCIAGLLLIALLLLIATELVLGVALLGGLPLACWALVRHTRPMTGRLPPTRSRRYPDRS